MMAVQYLSSNCQWPRVKLGEHVNLLTGYPFSSAEYVLDEDGVRLLRGDNVGQGFLRWDGVKKWPRANADDFAKFDLQAGDVILAMDRPWIEAGLKYAHVTPSDLPALLVQRVARMRGCNGLATDFLRYVIGSPEFTSHVHSITTGTAVPHISAGDICGFELLLPPLPIQRKIAAILSAYDDLIENNTRRIALLEEMAQALYHEWFVRFRFPGHEAVPLVDSPLGAIPEGWQVVKLSSLVETQYGYTESATTDEVGPKFLRGMDINKNSYIQWDTVPYCPIPEGLIGRYRLATGDIVVIRMADPGKVGIVEKDADAIFASYLIRLHIVSPQIAPYYLFYFLLSARYQDYITGASTGTTRKSASAGVITDIDIPIPPSSILSQFEAQATELRTSINNLLDQNANLRQTRDLLLPKLVSGAVDVAGMEITELIPRVRNI